MFIAAEAGITNTHRESVEDVTTAVLNKGCSTTLEMFLRSSECFLLYYLRVYAPSDMS